MSMPMGVMGGDVPAEIRGSMELSVRQHRPRP